MDSPKKSVQSYRYSTYTQNLLSAKIFLLEEGLFVHGYYSLAQRESSVESWEESADIGRSAFEVQLCFLSFIFYDNLNVFSHLKNLFHEFLGLFLSNRDF